MKKAGIAAFALTIALLAGFLFGFYYGRNATHYPVQLRALPYNTAVESSLTFPTTLPTEGEQKVDVNTASAAMLQTLPGIGEVLAQRIIDYREENGPLNDLAALLNVEGIGEKKLEAILDYATVGG